jgi:hypothetical protein
MAATIACSVGRRAPTQLAAQDLRGEALGDLMPQVPRRRRPHHRIFSARPIRVFII